LVGDHADRIDAPFLQQLDLAPLRALLKKLPAPPAAPPAAREGAPLDKSRRAAVEAEVYRALLAYQAHGAEQAVISDMTLAHDADWRAPMLGAALPDVLASALSDFDKVANVQEPFPDGLDWGMKVHLLSSRESGEAFTGGWPSFWKRFKGHSGLFHFSRVGLSKDGTQAVVQVDWATDSLAGSGDVWLLAKDSSGWHVRYVIPLWIS
jgi:hypothetical protein